MQLRVAVRDYKFNGVVLGYCYHIHLVSRVDIRFGVEKHAEDILHIEHHFSISNENTLGSDGWKMGT